jgi:hypothetical protein
MFDRFDPSDTERSRGLLDEVCASWRAEARAAARRLGVIGELFALRLAESGDSANWAVDTWAAVCAEVAAALRISVAMASSYLRYAVAMRERLPRVASSYLRYHQPDRVDLRHRPAAAAGHQGTRLAGRRGRDGVQAHRVRTSPLARRQRASPRGSGPCRRPLREGQARRTTRRIRR